MFVRNPGQSAISGRARDRGPGDARVCFPGHVPPCARRSVRGPARCGSGRAARGRTRARAVVESACEPYTRPPSVRPTPAPRGSVRACEPCTSEPRALQDGSPRKRALTPATPIWRSFNRFLSNASLTLVDTPPGGHGEARSISFQFHSARSVVIDSGAPGGERPPELVIRIRRFPDRDDEAAHRHPGPIWSGPLLSTWRARAAWPDPHPFSGSRRGAPRGFRGTSTAPAPRRSDAVVSSRTTPVRQSSCAAPRSRTGRRWTRCARR